MWKENIRLTIFLFISTGFMAYIWAYHLVRDMIEKKDIVNIYRLILLIFLLVLPFLVVQIFYKVYSN